MSSFQGKSASACDLVPFTVTACLFAGGAESSGPPGLLRSSILTMSSDGGATVLASSLIRATVGVSEEEQGGETAVQVIKKNR